MHILLKITLLLLLVINTIKQSSFTWNKKTNFIIFYFTYNKKLNYLKLLQLTKSIKQRSLLEIN